jgi:aspartate racemase
MVQSCWVPQAQALARRGAQALILGCTEVPLVLDAGNSPLPVIDATDALARRAVAWSLSQTQAGVGATRRRVVTIRS